MKAVIYARYSSDNQREESIEGQIRECTAFAEKNGITILRHYIDRFARNRYDSARYKAALKKNGVKVISATEKISDGSEGILMESVLEGFAEYYSADLAEKVVRGMTDNALKCKFNGGKVPIGYTIDEEKHFQIDPLVAPFVLEAYKRYAEGASMTAIRDWLNKNRITNAKGKPITYNSVHLLLKNRRYIGEFTFRDTVIPDGIPAIVPTDLFDKVQARMERNATAPAHSKAKEEYLLTTKLFCGYCGAYLCGESGTGRNGETHHYYKCVSVKKKRAECNLKSAKKQWLEDLVVNETIKLLNDDAIIEAIVSRVMSLQQQENKQIPLLEAQLKETEEGIENLLKAIQMGILTKSTKDRLQELEAAKEELENRITLEKMDKPQLPEEFVRYWLQRFRGLDTSSTAQRKLLIDVFLNTVYLFNDKVVITFNYKEDAKTINFSEIEDALKKRASGSDLEFHASPRQNKTARSYDGADAATSTGGFVFPFRPRPAHARLASDAYYPAVRRGYLFCIFSAGLEPEGSWQWVSGVQRGKIVRGRKSAGGW